MGAVRIARWVTLGALFLIPFLPLFLDEAFYFPFVAGRGFAFRLLTEAAVASWLVMAAAEPRYRPRASWIAVLFALLVAWTALADAFALDPNKAFWSTYERMDGWVTLAHLFALFVVAGCVLGAEQLWNRWWLAFALASALVCGVGLLQIAQLKPAPAWPRVDANFGNPEFLASYLLFAIPTTLWLALDGVGATSRIWRGGLLALAVLQALILTASGTRGAYAGLAAGAVFGGVLWLRRAGRLGLRIAALALTPLALFAGVLVAVRLAPAWAQNPIIARLTGAGLGELGIRFTLWRMAWEGFLVRPLTGWGHEGFIDVFYRFFSPSLAGYAPWFDRAHDLYLDWLVTGGLPALLLFVGLLASAAVALTRGPFSPAGRILLLSALVAYGVQGLVVFDNLMSYVPLTALFALAHSALARQTPARAADAPSPRAPWIAAPLALSGLALVLGFATLPGLRANLDLDRVVNPAPGEPIPLGYFRRALDEHGFAAEEICGKLANSAIMVAASDAPEADKRAFEQYAIGEMRAELVRAPDDARSRFILARLYRSVGDADDALDQAELGLRIAPNSPPLLRERVRDERPASGGGLRAASGEAEARSPAPRCLPRGSGRAKPPLATQGRSDGG